MQQPPAVLNANRCLFIGNTGSNGGAIATAGSTSSANLTDCVFDSNSVSGYGGALNNNSTTTTITRCTFSNNTAYNAGGGIHHSVGTITISNSTFFNNTVTWENGTGGAIGLGNGTSTLVHCTVTGNSATGGHGGAGGVYGSDTVNIGRSIVAGNHSSGSDDVIGLRDIQGSSFKSQGYNVIGVRDYTGTAWLSTDKVGTVAAPLNPGLLTDPQSNAPLLQNNGGPTPTIGLRPDSIALDIAPFNSVTTDQRGKPRNAIDSGSAADAGALELQSPRIKLNGASSESFQVTFTENSLPVAAANTNDLTVTTDLDANLDSAAILLQGSLNNNAESLLLDLGNSGLVLTPSTDNDGTQRYTLTGSASPAVYRQVLRTLRYTNSLDDPGTGDRTVTITLASGLQISVADSSTIHLVPVNDAPVFTKGADLNVLEDCGPQTVENWATGISAIEAAQTIHFVVSSDAPSLFAVQPAVSPTGTLTFTPTADASGVAKVTIQAKDNGGSADGGIDTSAPQTFTIEVTPVNDAPIVQGKQYTLAEDTSQAIVLEANDIDSSNFTFTFITPPQHGTLSGTAPYLIYTPALNYHGTDSFTFEASDGELTSNLATVTLTIESTNDAPVVKDDEVSTPEDTALDIDVLSNDSDVESTLTIARLITTTATHGTVTINPDGTLHYKPDANFYGTGTFSYAATDGTLERVAQVIVVVASVDDAPVALDDIYRFQGRFLAGLPGVLANDSDVDDETATLTATVESGPTHGTLLAFWTGGQFFYRPQLGFTGLDSFVYRVSDGKLSATATVTLDVTSTPVPAPGITISSPQNGSRSSNFPEISGIVEAAPDGAELDRVIVSVRRATDGLYWSGSQWLKTPSYLPTKLTGSDASRRYEYEGDVPADSNLRAGIYYVAATVYDTLGNRATRAVSFRIVDNQAPAVTLEVTLSPRVGQPTRMTQVIGTIVDEPFGSGPARVILFIRRSSDGFYWNGARWVAAATALRTTLRGSGNRLAWMLATPLPGTSPRYDSYAVTAYGYDRSGNRGQAINPVGLFGSTPATRSTSSGPTAADNGLSLASANSSRGSVDLTFERPIDASTADSAVYQIRVNGEIVPLESIAYNATTATISLLLSERYLQRGDNVTVSWKGLHNENGAPLSGETVVRAQ